MDVFSDSDWAGCLKTRKSCTGGLIAVNGGIVKSWSTSQGSVALSSGEAELYAGIKGAAEGIGLESLLKDLGVEVKSVRLWQDSSAAIGMASRTGIGKVRHMETRFLWLQELVKSGRVVLKKIGGESNPADVLTKPKSHDEMAKVTEAVGVKLKKRCLEEGERD